ncbi:MAG: SDR family oxidoreductase [Chlorobiaceae bacterium]|nr:SDR family oxidoreductase [Chlorobiaceae bacterium]
MQKERISILGCGWLGLPLAQEFIGAGYRVKGSTTRAEKLEGLKAAGIEPFRIVLGEAAEGDLEGFLDSEVLIVNIPPGRGEEAVGVHVEQISRLIDALAGSPVEKVLFVSSTSVYPPLNREVFEQDASDPDAAEGFGGRALLYVEDMLRSETAFRTTVVRFSGLIGHDRNPARYLLRMKELADPEQPMNLIHRDDCIGIISAIISQGKWGEVYNASCELHPKRKEFYEVAAESLGVELPSAAAPAPPKPFKTVGSRKLVESLGYRFLHPDPLDVAREGR